ncbi:MAG TPA: hypothetical protein VFG53_07470 [Anaeromyxobacter sp.]|nr:hypothetical protein [Anaeromyxobacter sp.]
MKPSIPVLFTLLSALGACARKDPPQAVAARVEALPPALDPSPAPKPQPEETEPEPSKEEIAAFHAPVPK